MLKQREIKTERLTLSRPYLTDAEAFFSALSDGALFKYNAWQKHENALETLAYVNRLMIRWDNGATEWVVRDEEENAVGIVCLREEEEGVELGFWIASAFQKKGYGSEAVSAAVSYAKECGVKKLRAVCHPKNAASLKILEKSGFHIEREAENDFVGEDFEPTDVLYELSAFN